jgi:hypothetical protein
VAASSIGLWIAFVVAGGLYAVLSVALGSAPSRLRDER